MISTQSELQGHKSHISLGQRPKANRLSEETYRAAATRSGSLLADQSIAWDYSAI